MRIISCVSGQAMISILYSADYEVFLGRNFLPEPEVLIGPTRDLLAACRGVGIRMTLFADVFCLRRYRELGQEEFPGLADEQLRGAIASGHDVQAHIHPHWTCTGMAGGAYFFDRDKYLLGTFYPDKVRRDNFIRDSVREARDYLEGLLRPGDPAYRCIAFRAGGYGLQPGEDAIVAALADAGFLVDSSVVHNLRLENEINRIDYTGLPGRGNYWLAGGKGPATSGSAGGIFEIPIASARLGIHEELPFIMKRFGARLGRMASRQGGGPRGLSVQEELHLYPGLLLRILNRIRLSSLHHMDLTDDPDLMMLITRKYLASALPEQGDFFFSVNCHPKTMSAPHFAALKEYHRMLCAEFPGIRSITYREAAGMIPHGPAPLR
ncbi:MAG TPA: hypothetical protein VMB35_07310 [Methanomicrobiales archaeon]|nr:hypothetical protein [Methanomicrobiales archaeon]